MADALVKDKLVNTYEDEDRDYHLNNARTLNTSNPICREHYGINLLSDIDTENMIGNFYDKFREIGTIDEHYKKNKISTNVVDVISKFIFTGINMNQLNPGND